MGVNTQKFIRKPLYVDAVRVTANNFDEIAAWCQGEVMTDEVPGTGTTKKYIKVRVHNPKNPRQTKAFIGDWLLYTERGYKVYTNKAFRAAFDAVEYDDAEVIANQAKERAEREQQEPATAEQIKEALPHAQDKRPHVIEEAKLESVGPVAEEPDPAGTGVQPIESVERIDESSAGIEAVSTEHVTVEPELLEDAPPPVDEVVQAASRPPVQTAVDPHTTPQGEPHEYVEATPRAIADAVSGQQPIEEPTVPVEPAGEGVSVESSPTSPPVEPVAPPEVAPQPQPVSEQAPQDAAAGKYVISEQEQRELGPDGVRELLQTGDAILAQDLASA